MTPLTVGGASRRGALFSIKLDSVTLSREAIEIVITCVQDFVRDSLFTQKISFSDSGVAMIKDAKAVADSIIVSEEINPWSLFGDGCNQQVVRFRIMSREDFYAEESYPRHK